MKEKMPIEKKTRLIFLGEYLLIAAIALVVGILKMAGVIPTKPTRLLIYNIISIVGAAYLAFDLIWYMISAKKRARTDLLDKLVVLPVLLYLVGFDIYCFINYGKPMWDIFVVMSIGSALVYIAIIYIFLGIYRYKHPSKQIQEAIKELEEEQAEKQAEEVKEVVEIIESKEENKEE